MTLEEWLRKGEAQLRPGPHPERRGFRGVLASIGGPLATSSNDSSETGATKGGVNDPSMITMGVSPLCAASIYPASYHDQFAELDAHN